ncbi:MAG: metal-dependent hydrolase [Sphingopyxis sp.]
MSSLSLSPTPEDLVITPRDRRFGRSGAQPRWWADGDPIATAYYNALSVTFPRGEAMFIEAVKAHRDGVSPKLAAEIRAFTSQEVMHSREHVAFNRKIEEAGYELAELNADVEEILAILASRPQIVNLLATIALEHYTAMMAADMLSRDDFLAKSDPAWADLWRWHAIEEIEHKGVAYDTFLHATKDWSRSRRWRAKSLTMLLVTMRFWPRRVKGMKALLRQDGLSGWRVGLRIWWFLLGKPGVLRRLIPAWIAYFLPGFHPWNRDDRALIGKVDSAFAEANRAGALAA